jgi:hypothetical protein
MNPSTKITALAGLALAAGSLQAAVIFQDDFSGGAVTLNGTTPDTTTGAADWVSASSFSADGSFLAGSGNTGSSATLDFTPSSGEVYTLDARADVTSTAGWLAMGFATGQSIETGYARRFVNSSNPLGRSWMLLLEDGGTGVFQDGTATAYTEDGSISPVAGAVDIRIVLDTTAATWTSTWYAKDATDSVYTTIMGTQNVVSQGSIDSVGFALSGSDAPGTITSFSLSSVPEPSAAALLGIGGLALILRRQK